MCIPSTLWSREALFKFLAQPPTYASINVIPSGSTMLNKVPKKNFLFNPKIFCATAKSNENEKSNENDKLKNEKRKNENSIFL